MTDLRFTREFRKRRDAILQARDLRKRYALQFKVYRRCGTYTQPGRGIVAYCHYEVRQVAS